MDPLNFLHKTISDKGESKDKNEAIINELCHNCNTITKQHQSIKCSNQFCLSIYCLKCFSEKHYSFRKDLFKKAKTSTNWKCFKCKLVCNCKTCLKSNQLNQSGQWYLQKKRSRLIKKLTKHQTTKKNVAMPQPKSAMSIIQPPQKKNVSSNMDKIEDIEKNFPNYKFNMLLNGLIFEAAKSSSLSNIKRERNKSNKPCILCTKFKCPDNIIILRFKTYEEYTAFILNLLKGIENILKGQSKEEAEANMEVAIERKRLQLILNQKNRLDQFEASQQVRADNKLKGPKRFCSNCLANIFPTPNGLMTIYDSLKDADEQASLEPKKKLEIMEGLTQLIIKEKGGKNITTDTAENKKHKGSNIFNEIFSGGKAKKEQENNAIDNSYILQSNLLGKMEMFNDSKKNPIIPKEENKEEMGNINININSSSNTLMGDLFNRQTDARNFDTSNNPHSHPTNLFNQEYMGNDLFFNLKPLSNAPQTNNETMENPLLRNLGLNSNSNPSLLFNSGINYRQDNRAITALNMNASNPGATSNIINSDYLRQSYAMNQMNPMQFIPSQNVNQRNIPMSNTSNSTILPYALSCLMATNYFYCLKSLKVINNQHEFTLKQIQLISNDFENLLYQFIYSNSLDQRRVLKNKIDASLFLLHEQILLSNFLLQQYEIELTSIQLNNDSF